MSSPSIHFPSVLIASTISLVIYTCAGHASINWEQANSLRAAGSYEEAIQLYTKAIHINERIGGYAGRAYCRFLLGDYEQAERDANTSMYNRSAKDLMQPGMMGMAEYVRGVCRYRRGQFTEAEADLRAAASSRYGTDEVRQMYQDCQQKAAAAREQAVIDKVKSQFATVNQTISEALRTNKIKAYDLSNGDSWWRSDADRQDFEKTMQRTAPLEGATVLQDFTKYLWIKASPEDKYMDIVAFVPRHTAITGGDGTIYRDKVVLVQVSSVPRDIKLVADLPPCTIRTWWKTAVWHKLRIAAKVRAIRGNHWHRKIFASRRKNPTM